MTFENHQTDARISAIDVAPFFGASHNASLDNNNPLIVEGWGMSDIQYAVRRITPTEGERLQGFPDGWTRPCFTAEMITDELVDRFINIFAAWDEMNGKPGKRKTRKQVREWLIKISGSDCPDGPRYKAIGNSMSVNVMEWIGIKVARADRRIHG